MRVFFYLLSFIFLINSIVLTIRKSFTLGLAIMFILTFSFFIFANFFDFWISITKAGTGLIFRYLVIASVICFIFLLSFILSYARTNVSFKENAIIVLGCGLNEDGTPSYTLKKRLDGCIDYYNKNQKSYIIVTGGYSRKSSLTEADSMKKYLISKGIPENKIFCENKATNTRENFEYSLEILKNLGIDETNIAFVTNSFHCYRAAMYAKEAGFENTKIYSVKTDKFVFIPAVLRETCAVAAMMFFKF